MSSHAAAAYAAEGHASVEAQEYNWLKLGMWLFLASEIMFFGGFFSSYLITRLGTDVSVEAWQKDLHSNRPLAAANTLVLIISSLTMALAVTAAHKANKTKALIFLGLTTLCGVVFMVIKFFEYGAKLGHDLTPKTSVLWGFYYMMTGFHGLHVVGGVIAIWILMLLMWRKDWFLGEYKHGNVEITGLYWHFVDVVWIFLFPLMYLI